MRFWCKHNVFYGTPANEKIQMNKAAYLSSLLILVSFISSITQVNSKESETLPQINQIEWQAWTPDIFEQAKKQNRLLLVDISAIWCTFCQKMDATTYQDPEVLKEIYDHFLPVRVKEGDPNTPDVERFSEYTRPTTAIYNAEGIELIAKKGYLKPQWMTWLLQAIHQNPVVDNDE